MLVMNVASLMQLVNKGGSFVYAGAEGYLFDATGEQVDIPVSSDAELNRLSGSTRGAALLNASHTEVRMDVEVSVSKFWKEIFKSFNSNQLISGASIFDVHVYPKTQMPLTLYGDSETSILAEQFK